MTAQTSNGPAVEAQDVTRPGRYIGRVAAITGSSSGHGRAIARALAREGAAVVCSDIRKSPLPDGFEDDIEVDTDELIRRHGGRADFIEANVMSAADMRAVVERAVSGFGRLDLFVNNAGIFVANASVVDEPEDAWDRTFDINVKGTWWGCKAAVAQMREQDPNPHARGRIVNIGSIAGEIGQADLGSYSASKGAVHNLTRALAIECAPQRINVNAIAPGYFPTAMNRDFFDDPATLAHIKEIHPWPALGSPDDIGAAVAFLGSDDARWITGAVLPVDGGFLAK
jgi:NAD(P)-dependent dehydrogenase (short-subunit alcohol dehydrogenase family)